MPYPSLRPTTVATASTTLTATDTPLRMSNRCRPSNTAASTEAGKASNRSAPSSTVASWSSARRSTGTSNTRGTTSHASRALSASAAAPATASTLVVVRSRPFASRRLSALGVLGEVLDQGVVETEVEEGEIEQDGLQQHPEAVPDGSEVLDHDGREQEDHRQAGPGLDVVPGDVAGERAQRSHPRACCKSGVAEAAPERRRRSGKSSRVLSVNVVVSQGVARR